MPAAPNATHTVASNATLHPNTTSWMGSPTSGNKVALQTALGFIVDKRERKVRVLFDSRSQKSFVTSEAVCMMGLNVVRKENLGIRVFGRNETEYAMRDVVGFSISPVNRGKSINIECFVVPKIANMNEHVESVKHDYPHLKR